MTERGFESPETVLKVAVVGAGRHARTTIYPAMIAAGYDIKAVVTRHLDNADWTARRFGGGSAFDDVSTMLASLDSDVEAIVLVLPADQYEDTILKCLPKGLPIYCEKPIALDSEVLRRVEEARAKYNGKVMAGYMKRFAPAYVQAKSLVTADEFGSPTCLHAYWGMGPSFPTLDYLMRENATHYLDLARYLMGEADEVEAYSWSPTEGCFAVGILIRFSNGAVGTISVNNASAWDHDNEWLSVTGQGPVVAVDNVENCIYRVPGAAERRWTPNHTVPLPQTSSLTITGFTGAFEHFSDVVRRNAHCMSDLSSAIRTTELSERVIAAAANSKPAA